MKMFNITDNKIEKDRSAAECSWNERIKKNWDSTKGLTDLYDEIQLEREYPQHVYGPNEFEYAPYLKKIIARIQKRIDVISEYKWQIEAKSDKKCNEKLIILAKINGMKRMLEFVKDNKINNYHHEDENASNSINIFCNDLRCEIKRLEGNLALEKMLALPDLKSQQKS